MGVLSASLQRGDQKSVEVASAVNASATAYNYTAHWDVFQEQYDACAKVPSGAGCSTILKMGNASSQSLGSVVLNTDADGSIVSYTLLDELGKPWMVMEPEDHKYYITLPEGLKNQYKTAPQWELNLSSALLYAAKGETEKGFTDYGFMLRNPEYQLDAVLGLASMGIGSLTLRGGVGAATKVTGAYADGVNGGAGLGILAGREVKVSSKGLDIVENHLVQFRDVPENSLMIERHRSSLANGRPLTGADASFYVHEIANPRKWGAV